MDLKAQTGLVMVILLTGVVILGFFLTSNLLKKSGELGEEGFEAEEKATKVTPLGPQIIEVVGYAGDGGVAIENVTKLMITLSLSPGSVSIPYGQLILSYRSKELFIPRITYNKTLGSTESSKATDNDFPDYGVLPIVEEIKNDILEKDEIIELHFWIEDKSGDHPLVRGNEFLVTVASKGTMPAKFTGEVPKKVNTLYVSKWA